MASEKLPGAASPVGEGITALRHLIAAGEQFRRAIAAHFGVGESETVALTHLRLAGPQTPGELAERVGLTPSTVTALLDRLEAAALAVRSSHPTDRRKSVITISDRGEELLAIADEHLVAALAGLGEQATVTLERIAEQISAQAIELQALPPRNTD